MPYTATITKQSVTKQKDGFIINISVVVNDGANDIFEQSFKKRHYTGDPLSEIEAVFQEKIKNAWDKYISEQTIFENASFDSLCSDLDSSLTTYINQ